MADVSPLLDQIVGGLTGLAAEVIRVIPDDRPLNEIWGWNMPAMTRHELADFVKLPVETIQNLKSRDFSDEDAASLSRIPAQINFIQANALPQLPGGNAFHVYIVFASFVEKLDALLIKYGSKHDLDWDNIEDQKMMPTKLVSRLQTLDGQISNITDKKASLETSVTRILEASALTKTIGRDIESLQSARDAFTGMQNSINDQLRFFDQSESTVRSALKEIEALNKTASDLVVNTKGAFAAATTIGLGREFDLKAGKLAHEVRILSAALLLILSVGASITYFRIEFIHHLMEAPPINLDLIWANIVTMFATLAGPVWLAWLVTKQIGQRFRLSEDYAFKASVAKAYAGYRQEASRIADPDLERLLFRVAINRMDEEPLRYVEHESDGSPWHSLLRRRKWRVGPVETSDLDAPPAKTS